MIVLARLSILTARRNTTRRIFANSFALFICSQMIIACHSLAPPGIDHLAETPDESASPLRIGTSGDYLPFSDWPSDEPAPSGFSVDLARAFVRSSGREIEWVRFAWPSLATRLANDEFDLALSGVTVRPDRSTAGRFSLPLTISGAIVLMPRSNASKVSANHEALNDPSFGIAVNAGGHLERTTRRLFPRARIVPIADNAVVLDALDQPEVDAVVTDTLEAPIWQARRMGLHAIGPLTRDRKAAWFSGDHAALEIERFDRWLIDAEASGALARLRAAWNLPNEQTATLPAALLARLDERLSLMQAVARTKLILGRPIEDRPREARVIKAAGKALESAIDGLPQTASGPIGPTKVDRFYRAQIEAAKWIQREWTRRQVAPAESSESSKQAALRELEDELRPALIFLGDRIAALVAESSVANNDIPTLEITRQALARHRLPTSFVDEISDSLSDLLNHLAADR